MLNSLKDQNGAMADKMMLLVNETGKREGDIEKIKMEFQLQMKLLEHQVRQIKPNCVSKVWYVINWILKLLNNFKICKVGLKSP